MNVESQEYRPVLELYQGPCLLKHPVYAMHRSIFMPNFEARWDCIKTGLRVQGFNVLSRVIS